MANKRIMKRLALFLLGFLSAFTLTIFLVKDPDDDPDEKLKKDKKKLD